jgi:hypothetical protein
MSHGYGGSRIGKGSSRVTADSVAGRSSPWDALRGMVCTCPPDCTGDRWGNGPRDCDPKCRPCTIMRGAPYVRSGK